jgi:hypothetical protein
MLMSNLEVFVLQKGRRDNEPWSLRNLWACILLVLRVTTCSAVCDTIVEVSGK